MMSVPRPRSASSAAPRTVDDPATALRYELLDEAARVDDLIPLGLGDPDLPTRLTSLTPPSRRSTPDSPTWSATLAGLFELRAAVADRALAREWRAVLG